MCNCTGQEAEAAPGADEEAWPPGQVCAGVGRPLAPQARGRYVCKGVACQYQPSSHTNDLHGPHTHTNTLVPKPPKRWCINNFMESAASPLLMEIVLEPSLLRSLFVAPRLLNVTDIQNLGLTCKGAFVVRPWLTLTESKSALNAHHSQIHTYTHHSAHAAPGRRFHQPRQGATVRLFVLVHPRFIPADAAPSHHYTATSGSATGGSSRARLTRATRPSPRPSSAARRRRCLWRSTSRTVA